MHAEAPKATPLHLRAALAFTRSRYLPKTTPPSSVDVCCDYADDERIEYERSHTDYLITIKCLSYQPSPKPNATGAFPTAALGLATAPRAAPPGGSNGNFETLRHSVSWLSKFLGVP